MTPGAARAGRSATSTLRCAGVWHTLRVEFAGTRIAVVFDGKCTIEVDDAHVAGAGAVGV
jgi:hypothetical protein